MFYHFIALLLSRSFVNAVLNTKVVIRQTLNPIDAKPIINLSEVQFFYNSILQTVPTSNFLFSTESSGYPVSKCNDGTTATGSSPYNMCKSGNDDAEERLIITLGTIAFNEIKVYNAYGFNNPGGYDVGLRIVGATIKVLNADTDAELFSSSFDSSANTYSFYPSNLTPNPTAAPSTAVPSTSFSPSYSRKPTAAPSFSFMPTVYVPPLGGRPGQGDGEGEGNDGVGDDDLSEHSSVRT